MIEISREIVGQKKNKKIKINNYYSDIVSMDKNPCSEISLTTIQYQEPLEIALFRFNSVFDATARMYLEVN